MDTQFQTWLQQARANGMTDDQIRQQLLATGWSAEQVQTALGSGLAVPMPPSTGYTPKNYTIGKHIFRRAFAETKSSYKYYLSLLAIGIAFVCVIAFAIYPQVRHSKIGILAIFLLCWFVVIIITYTATIIVTLKPTSHNELIKIALEKLPKLLWSSILAGVVISGGYLMFWFPGILMALAFTVLPFVVVRENVYGLRALQRCYTLVRGFRGNIFGAHVILGLVMLGVFVVEFGISFILLLIFGHATVGGTGFSLGFIVAFLPFLILYTVFPLYLAAYDHILYTDLLTIRPPGADKEIEENSKTRLLIYIIVGVIAIGLYVNTYVSYFKNIKPVTEQQYISINADLVCFMYKNGYLDSQLAKLDVTAKNAKILEGRQAITTETQKILLQNNITELEIEKFSSSKSATDFGIINQRVYDKANQDCGYVEKTN
jgi:hypothetical protein